MDVVISASSSSTRLTAALWAAPALAHSVVTPAKTEMQTMRERTCLASPRDRSSDIVVAEHAEPGVHQ
jgi:hypothetical protein